MALQIWIKNIKGVLRLNSVAKEALKHLNRLTLLILTAIGPLFSFFFSSRLTLRMRNGFASKWRKQETRPITKLAENAKERGYLSQVGSTKVTSLVIHAHIEWSALWYPQVSKGKSPHESHKQWSKNTLKGGKCSLTSFLHPTSLYEFSWQAAWFMSTKKLQISCILRPKSSNTSAPADTRK